VPKSSPSRRRSNRRPGGPRLDLRRRARGGGRSRPCSARPGGTSRGARSASGASTNSRSRASGCGTSRSLAGFPGSTVASTDWPAAGRSIESRARPKISRSRSSSRGPQRSRCWRPNARSRLLSATSRAVAPVAGSGPAGTVERNNRVPELRLVDDADGRRRVEARDADEARAGQGRERLDGRPERRLGVADVRAEPDVRPHPTSHWFASVDAPLDWPRESRRGEDSARRGRLEIGAPWRRGWPTRGPPMRSGSCSASFGPAPRTSRSPRPGPTAPSLALAFGRSSPRASGRTRVLVLLGSGSIPLAQRADLDRLPGDRRLR